MWIYTGPGPQQERVQLPRLGDHFASWGSGHTHSGPAHDGPCVCDCGITQPYDPEPHPQPEDL